MTAEPIWRPNPDQTPRPQILDFTDFANQRTGQDLANYDELWRWSVDDLDGFWGAVWDYFDVIADEPYTEVLADRSMPGASWFPGTRLNYAEHALRAALDDSLADEPAIITIKESGERHEITWRELRRQVGSVAAWLRDHDVRQGDRVVGYLPNTHHTLIASSPPPPSARSGPPAPRTTPPGEPRPNSDNSNRLSSSPPTATSGTARPTIAVNRSQTWRHGSRHCGRSSGSATSAWGI